MDFQFSETPILPEGEQLKCLYRGDIEDTAENKHITVEDGIVEIGESAFRDFVHLESITLPDSVEIINACAFSG